MRTTEDKVKTVLELNTYYFFDPEFEEIYQSSNLNAIANLLNLVRVKVEREGAKEEFFEELLTKPNGLRALLSLTGFSNESLKRLTTLVRLVDDAELDGLLLKSEWLPVIADKSDSIKEWSDSKIEKLVSDNAAFRKGLVRLFFEGASNPMLSKVIPPFELRKLSVDKLTFQTDSMIDTLVRYKEKGSYSGQAENNPEKVVKKMLDHLALPFTSGDLSLLVGDSDDTKRRMDFIVPDQKNPLVICESSFLVTTSSGQGDKSKTEINVRDLIKRYYPAATFIGFVDGIGWYARQNDLKRMVAAYDDVFTFHHNELERFQYLLRKTFAL